MFSKMAEAMEKLRKDRDAALQELQRAEKEREEIEEDPGVCGEGTEVEQTATCGG